ncbi:hypothetical protein LNKW23_47140 [Paralimibaculum aggregatum]|uniref:Uncharacterized protein n=1 Tax=Paralimibaculum aggregatum TaxID=3036245 RepID=A0ABQ6LTV5_9RHOB|nr:DUF6525 family protein [Limibaculum sp. NKW23]GMG85492.1 hypothetical protein LNKW23_47140 [Limibaculum sp. NKW23]
MREHRIAKARAQAAQPARAQGKNRGATSLKRRRRNEDPMREYDRLPADLRAWLASAVLPWRPRSVSRSFSRTLARTGDRNLALAELDRLQLRLIARDAAHVWGTDHPYAMADLDR